MVNIDNVSKNQFDNFLSKISHIDLERVKDDISTFPLDFQVVYQSKYLLNFEYLAPTLEFYVIGVIEKGKHKLCKNSEEMKKFDKILLKLKKKIEHIF